jgi:DNA-binding NarL/FixJ family response regulator
MRAIGEEMNVLMIGNNPLELARVCDFLTNIAGSKVITEAAFDLKGGLKLLAKFLPNFIIIDDNLGRKELTNAIRSLSRLRKTKNIPVTILKNSNYREAFGGVAMNYVLKENLSQESLSEAFFNFFSGTVVFEKSLQETKRPA